MILIIIQDIFKAISYTTSDFLNFFLPFWQYFYIGKIPFFGMVYIFNNVSNLIHLCSHENKQNADFTE